MPIFISRKMYNNLSITEETLEPLGLLSISLLPRGNLLCQLGVLPFSYFSVYLHTSVCTFRAIFFKLWLSPESV